MTDTHLYNMSSTQYKMASSENNLEGDLEGFCDKHLYNFLRKISSVENNIKQHYHKDQRGDWFYPQNVDELAEMTKNFSSLRESIEIIEKNIKNNFE